MKTRKSSKNISQDGKRIKKRGRIVAVVAGAFVFLPLFAIAVAVAGFAIYASTVKVDTTLLPTATAAPTFFDVHGNKICYAEDDFLSQDEIPDTLKYAFISTEDKRFYSHKGYDVIRIGGAIINDIKAGKAVEGASTITQQLVKNTHLSNKRTLTRKLKEIAIASKLEKKYEKDEILSMYLSVIYFGNGIYGAKQASKYYFEKDVKDLTIAESATLAAIVKNPSKYSPNKNPEAAKTRRNSIIDKMCEQNFISLDTAKSEKSRGLDYVVDVDDKTRANSFDIEKKLYFDSAIKEVCTALDITKYQLFNGGYEIYTNFDAEAQAVLLDVIKNNPSGEENLNRVALLVDNSNGAVLGYASTLGYTPKRQVGSTIKPILYSAAMDTGLINLATPVFDEQINYGGYSPSNYADKYYGHTTIKEAIKKSMNSVAVKTLDYLGVDEYYDYAERFGLTLNESDKNYALALGATQDGISLTELASAYCVIASNGQKRRTQFVRFAAQNGFKAYSSEVDDEQILKPSTAQLMTVALKDTVEDGTARTLSALPFDVAAKTGTAQRADGMNSDAWCVSFTPQYTLLLWHGSDDGSEEKGGGYPTKQSYDAWRALYDRNFANLRSEQEFKTDELKLEEVDLYSTFSTKQVVKANENTPIEYRKTEYFAIDDTLIESGSCFDEILEPEFEIRQLGNGVEIKFDAQNIFEYELYCMDMLGNRLIKTKTANIKSIENDFNKIFENATETVVVKHRPFTFGKIVEYRLVVRLANDKDIKNESTKTVFVDSRY
ncbi:MAG: transglycosylase domain-containing protein [Clostridia bacterium]|nr:transglycosylase domain-containing protein [Clostridia bacterium]